MKQKCISCKRQVESFKEIITSRIIYRYCPHCEHGKDMLNTKLVIGYPSEEHLVCNCSPEKTLHTTFINDFSELYCQCINCKEIKFATKIKPGMCINEFENCHGI